MSTTARMLRGGKGPYTRDSLPQPPAVHLQQGIKSNQVIDGRVMSLPKEQITVKQKLVKYTVHTASTLIRKS